MGEAFDKVLLLGSIKHKDVSFVDYGDLVISKEDEFGRPMAYTFRDTEKKIQMFDIPKERVMLGDTLLLGGGLLFSPKKILIIRQGIGKTSVDEDISIDISREMEDLRMQNQRLTFLVGRSIRLIRKTHIERLEKEVQEELLDFTREVRKTVKTPSSAPAVRIIPTVKKPGEEGKT